VFIRENHKRKQIIYSWDTFYFEIHLLEILLSLALLATIIQPRLSGFKNFVLSLRFSIIVYGPSHLYLIFLFGLFFFVLSNMYTQLTSYLLCLFFRSALNFIFSTFDSDIRATNLYTSIKPSLSFAAYVFILRNRSAAPKNLINWHFRFPMTFRTEPTMQCED
jgi:hypothetical protein